MIGRLLRAMETAERREQQEVAKVISRTISRVAEVLEAPVHIAVIPAAGGQHRVVATHVMQRLLLGAISEAAESGITNIILVLPPGMKDSLYEPLKDAIALAIAPAINLESVEQAKAEGLGDAILQAEQFVGERPFAVLLPDDVVQERIGRTAYARELRRMMEASSQLDGTYLVTVAPVPKTKMSHCGVAKLGAKEILPDIHPILQLVEKPDPSHSIFRSARTYGIVGRYLLRPDIFDALRALKRKEPRSLQLTTALEQLCQAGQSIYAFDLKATRQDIGEVLDQASDLIGASSESHGQGR
jgi:UTP--glucose-1-phosphate uridylyltransferase